MPRRATKTTAMSPKDVTHRTPLDTDQRNVRLTCLKPRSPDDDPATSRGRVEIIRRPSEGAPAVISSAPSHTPGFAPLTLTEPLILTLSL
jgi:hypothetical protein